MKTTTFNVELETAPDHWLEMYDNIDKRKDAAILADDLWTEHRGWKAVRVVEVVTTRTTWAVRVEDTGLDLTSIS